MFTSGHLQGAIQYYKRALEIAPDDAGYLHHLAEAMHATGDIPGALKYYRKSLAMDPDDPKARYLYALSLRD
jgi:tetratricopeptide (TPR) repeat protein